MNITGINSRNTYQKREYNHVLYQFSLYYTRNGLKGDKMKQKTEELYRKIKKGKKVNYELVVSSFDYKPVDGIWFVYTTPGCLLRECIIPIERIQDYIPILGLIKHKSKIIDIISDINGKSYNDIANNLIKYLSEHNDK